jgi:ComF family protein
MFSRLHNLTPRDVLQGRAVATLSRALAVALDLLFPPSCAACGREGSFLCEACESGLSLLRRPNCALCSGPARGQFCPSCEASPPAYDGLRAPYDFTGPVRDMVHNLKYKYIRASAPDLGRLMAAYLWSESVPGGVLVPVPLHSRRERARGFNQSALLAREVGRLTGIPVAEDMLRRSRNTAPQVSMAGPVERRENIQGAFECIGDVAGLEVLLIDDVVTTGSTMSACAEPLKAAGASSVWGLALAR